MLQQAYPVLRTRNALEDRGGTVSGHLRPVVRSEKTIVEQGLTRMACEDVDVDKSKYTMTKRVRLQDLDQYRDSSVGAT